MGKVKESPRDVLPIDEKCIVKGDWKLITAEATPDIWQSPTYPNSTSVAPPPPPTDVGAGGCLFNVVEDPAEQSNVYADYPDSVESMSTLLNTEKTSYCFTSIYNIMPE